MGLDAGRIVKQDALTSIEAAIVEIIFMLFGYEEICVTSILYDTSLCFFFFFMNIIGWSKMIVIIFDYCKSVNLVMFFFSTQQKMPVD
jgi:hypothetical protein